MKPTLTRRRLALVLGGAACLSTGRSQPSPPSPEQELEAARKRLVSATAQIYKVPLTYADEPVTIFRA